MSVHLALELTKLSLEIIKALVQVGKEVYSARETVRNVRAAKNEKNTAAEEWKAAQQGLVPCKAFGRDDGCMYGVLDLKTVQVYQKGVFVDGELEGEGEMRTASWWYQGRFEQSLPHGMGKMVYIASGSIYIGEFVHGVRCGFGQLSTAKGSLYSGTWDGEGSFVKGTIVTPKGICFTGVCENFSPVHGDLVYPSGITYSGQVKDWTWHGNGTLTFPLRNAETGKPYRASQYVGQFSACAYDGHGTMTYRNGKRWTGQWNNNEMGEGAWQNTAE